MLGTQPDEEIAQLLGRTPVEVKKRRAGLGVRFRKQPPSGQQSWTLAEEQLVGTDTDRAVARKLGRTHSSVMHKRVRLGLPAFHRNTWTEAQERLVRTATAREAARRLGRSLSAVIHKRVRLGLPAIGSSRKKRPGMEDRAAAGAS
jgi:hypothetical protein